MNFNERPLIITDVETTGLDARVHDIIEIGAIKVKQDSLEILDEFEDMIHIQHPDTVEQEALDINGYKYEVWRDNAHFLSPVMEHFNDFAVDGIFTAWNVTFDWSFVNESFRRTNLTSKLDYHRIDIPSIAWFLNPYRQKINLPFVCEEFGVPEEPKPHRAINGARKNLEILRAMKAQYLDSIWRS